jgi:hypothetical protein
MENLRWMAGSSGVGGRMVLQRDEGGVEALRWRGFTGEEEMRGGALNSCYAEAEREEGREWGPRFRHVDEERGGGGPGWRALEAVGDGRAAVHGRDGGGRSRAVQPSTKQGRRGRATDMWAMWP